MKKNEKLISTFSGMVILLLNRFKWQYMNVAGAGARAVAKLMEKGGAGAENK